MATKQYVPQEVTQMEMALGGDMKKLLPAVDDIPIEYFSDENHWNQQMSTCFFYGAEMVDLEMKENIDRKMAIRHIGAILGSFEPKHEVKIAGCAFLASQFFDKFEIIKRGK